MRGRTVIAVLGALALVLAGLFWLLDQLTLQSPTRTPEAVAEVERGSSVGRPAVFGACRLSGLIEGGIAQRVYVQFGGLQLPARLSRGGRAFSIRLDRKGGFEVFAVAASGQTASRRGHCGASGRAQVTLRIPNAERNSSALKGRCLYLETGAPVPEAIVRAHPAIDEGHGPRVMRKALSWSTVSDAEGLFSLAVKAGSYAVFCSKDGDQGRPKPVQLDPGEKIEVELYMEAKAAVAGRVVDEKGAAVPGVWVVGRGARLAAVDSQARARSDAQGRFLLEGLSAGAALVEAHHEGTFAEGPAVAKIALPYAEVELVLRPAKGAVSGTVSKTTGERVEGARVIARGRIRRETRSGPEGRFFIGGLAPGRYSLSATLDGSAEARIPVEVAQATVQTALMLAPACTAKITVLPDKPPLPVVLTVQSESFRKTASGQTGEAISVPDVFGVATIIAKTSGTVVRTLEESRPVCGRPIVLQLKEASEDSGSISILTKDADGAPLAKVKVWAEGPGRRGLTDAEGRAQFEGLKPGRYRVGAQDVQPKAVEVTAGAATDVEFVIERQHGAIRGRVVAQGAGVEGARILAACGDNGVARSLRNAAVVARSETSGDFEFEPRGGVCSVRAEHHQHGRSTPVTLSAGGAEAELRLVEGATIEGRAVLQSSGLPVTTPFTVSVRPVERGAELESQTRYIHDPEGRFELQDVSAGRVEVSVEGEQGKGLVEISVGASGKTQLTVPLFLKGSVVGRVLGREEPIQGAVVTARSGRRSLGRSVTGPDGQFQVQVPSGRALQVYVSASGYYPWGSSPLVLDANGPTDVGDVQMESRGGPQEKEGGIGIAFSQDPEGVRVIRFLADSPAREAGMEIGDVITAIAGVPAGRAPLVNWLVSLRGEPNTPVVLQIKRGASAPFSVTVIRRSIGLQEIPSQP